jgi:hypothetical protein
MRHNQAYNLPVSELKRYYGVRPRNWALSSLRFYHLRDASPLHRVTVRRGAYPHEGRIHPDKPRRDVCVTRVMGIRGYKPCP